ncbi:Alpha-ketoglutarate-dependent 2,4-dichlorophenoxyacetate dioxygenase [Streptomyces hundungensis]|uniref:Alpha-ketoglutarate-dependent 2,4-dichlorophenoxyacetate dioxygenase n=1 Tax=Streptomyces hundungensis TaxID=1077946 RepID=A0A387HNQ7_9ACTN|nr:TauD/TfdA family dioxygenase [Streptomyces hundungensis]AYG82520.1 Alpha-ketoglutarate-dependent 2,4-dichlorophenoxyacetate dioxygenase [Streptomyces hundungensis]
MQTAHLTPFIGTELTGATYEDLLRPEVWEEIVRQLHERELFVVRGLDITPEQQIELASRLGRPKPFLMAKYRHPEHEEIMISSNATNKGKPVGVARVGNFWHQDSSYQKDAAPYTMLHGVQVPGTSGHTLYANACDVYDRLPEEWKAKVEGRTAVHTVTKRQRIAPEHAGLSIAEFKALVEFEHPMVEHPLVKTDPGTGRRYIYGAPEYLDRVIGFDANENEAFFAVLDQLIQDPAHVYTHRWTPRDLVIWKTETTYHAATAIEPGVDRTVHRVSIEASGSWEA